MNLSDNDILELNELCNALVDGTIDDRQKQRLSHWLATSGDARHFYVRLMGQSASMYSYAAEMQSADHGTPRHKPHGFHPLPWALALLAVAASFFLVLWTGRARVDATASPPSQIATVTPTPTTQPQPQDLESVARITAGSKDCQWAGGSPPLELGDLLRKGQRIELTSGFAEVTFACGAQVVLQAPASLDATSRWSATLNRGKLKASIPPEAMGFSIFNPTVEVVDLGTEFTMFTDAAGTATDVLVLKGEVEAAPHAPADQRIVIREKESRRFTNVGMSVVHNSPEKLDELSQVVSLDRYLSPTGYAHWTFDETSGDAFKPFTDGLSADVLAVQLKNVANAGLLTAAHDAGCRQGALRFDGKLYAKAGFPGISQNTPHTIAFWVKVPKDAPLSNAYAMVAWGVNDRELGSHPIQICWNRSPDEGPVGVLRTDYGRGHALGATPLRDGQWHHIAVVFVPRSSAEGPLDVNQYIDGRLEGEGKPSKPGSEIFTYSDDNSAPAGGSSTLWLGCRYGARGGVRAERFQGNIDELFVVDRALEPSEIVRLMNENQL